MEQWVINMFILPVGLVFIVAVFFAGVKYGVYSTQQVVLLHYRLFGGSATTLRSAGIAHMRSAV